MASEQSEQGMLRATFFAALLVMVLCFLVLVVNWLSYLDRERVIGFAVDLERRVVALEAAKEQQQRLPQEKRQQK